jgi:hypothetical protein
VGWGQRRAAVPRVRGDDDGWGILRKAAGAGDKVELAGRCEVPIDIEEVIEKAFEQAFVKALEQTLQSKAEALFKKAFENGSPLSKKLEEKIEDGFQRFLEEGIRWQKKKAGFKK